MDWIKNRMPTEEEQAQSDIGFIICVSGTSHNQTYDHDIEMGIYYDHGHWYDIDGWIDTATDDITVHGWMMPPSWEEGGAE